MSERHAETFLTYSGDFASQQLAFAHLLDACEEQGRTIDFDHVEVVPVMAAPRRLATSLSEGDVAKLIDAATGDTLILVASRALGASETGLKDTARLTFLGVVEGTVLRATGGDWT